MGVLGGRSGDVGELMGINKRRIRGALGEVLVGMRRCTGMYSPYCPMLRSSLFPDTER
jgi:hypothetical protein